MKNKLQRNKAMGKKKKSRAFSIYLLKAGVEIAANALKEGHGLHLLKEGNHTSFSDGQQMEIYLSEGRSTPPWWRSYLGIERDLSQRQEGALVFIRCDIEGQTRIFAITFGSAFRKLRGDAYEYDFGLKATLNAIDPDKIKVTETIQPDSAKRQRMQSPSTNALTFFDFDRDQSVIKTLAGKAKPEFKERLGGVTGINNIRVTSPVEKAQLPELCCCLYDLYNREDYKQTFPDLFNVSAIKDPQIIQKLEDILLESYNGEDCERIVVTIPKMLEEPLWHSLRYTYLGKRSAELSEHSMSALKELIPIAGAMTTFHRAKLQVLDEEQGEIDSYPLKDCFVFDCQYEGRHYHLCDGSWYCVEGDYINRIEGALSHGLRRIEEYNLPPYLHQSEAEYNASVPECTPGYICLDRSNIAPVAPHQIEPCDLIRLDGGMLQLVHVKVSTKSAMLSHLFNQGAVSVDLLLSEENSRNHLKERLRNQECYNTAIDNKNFSIVFGIVTQHDVARGVGLLPLFSKISLYRVAKSLETKRISWSLIFIPKGQ